MKCPECGDEVYGQFAHNVRVGPGDTWGWSCRKYEPKPIDPAVLLDLVEKAIKRSFRLAKEMSKGVPPELRMMMTPLIYKRITRAIQSHLKGDPSALKKLAGVK
jgi:hypothetical protein